MLAKLELLLASTFSIEELKEAATEPYSEAPDATMEEIDAEAAEAAEESDASKDDLSESSCLA